MLSHKWRNPQSCCEWWGWCNWYREACLWTKIASYPGSLPAGEEPGYEAKPKLCGVVYHDTNIYPLRFDSSSLWWFITFSGLCVTFLMLTFYISRYQFFSLYALCMYHYYLEALLIHLMILYIGKLKAWRHVSRKISSGVAVRGEGGVAGEEKLLPLG